MLGGGGQRRWTEWCVDGLVRLTLARTNYRNDCEFGKTLSAKRLMLASRPAPMLRMEGTFLQSRPGLVEEDLQVFVQQRCAKGVHQVADMTIRYEVCAINIVPAILVWVCTINSGDTFLAEGSGAKHDEGFVGVVVLHVGQCTAIATRILSIIRLHEDVTKLFISSRWIFRCVRSPDERLEHVLDLIFVAFVEVVL